jgi:hypothetical protein
VLRAITGATRWAMNGPNVIAPHRPTTTLGIPAGNSRTPAIREQCPTAPARRRGNFSAIISAAPMDTEHEHQGAQRRDRADPPSSPMTRPSPPALSHR